jgi:hypothetical protein
MSKSTTLLASLKGTGKTTFLASMSKNVPDTFEELLKQSKEGKVFDCSDVVSLQGETDGDLGALNAGMKMRVIDLTDDYFNWNEYMTLLVKHLSALLPEVRAGSVRAIGVDLGPASQALQSYASGNRTTLKSLTANPDASFLADQSVWNSIAAQGLQFFNLLRTMPCHIVGMAHLKVLDAGMRTMKAAAADIERNQLERQIRSASEGADYAYTPDLMKGILAPWSNHSSQIFIPRKANVNVGTAANPKWEGRYYVQTAADDFAYAMCRAQSLVAPKETRTFNAILNQIEALRSR